VLSTEKRDSSLSPHDSALYRGNLPMTQHPCLSQPQYRIVVERNLSAQMRDGVTLYADVHRPDATGPFVELRWFDHWLKGIDTGCMREPPVNIFVMGDNVWREEWEWPLARTQYAPYYFHSQGAANSRHGNGRLSRDKPAQEPPDSYVYEPQDPVSTRGGNTLAIPMGVYTNGRSRSAVMCCVILASRLRKPWRSPARSR